MTVKEGVDSGKDQLVLIIPQDDIALNHLATFKHQPLLTVY